MTSTRSKTEIFGLGEAVTNEDGIITGSRLPTARQILRCALFHLQDGSSENRTKYEAAKIVYNQVLLYYQKGGVLMLAEQTSCQKIVKLLEEKEQFRKIPKARRETATVQAKLEVYHKELSQTFPLWVKDAEKMIENEEDKAFLISMMTDRKATIAGFDAVTDLSMKRKETRRLSEERRRQISEEEKQRLQSTMTLCDSCSSEDEQPQSSFNPKPKPESHKRKAKTGTEAFIPHDIIKSPKLVSLAARIKMTPTQQAAFTVAFVDEVGGDVSTVSTSYSQADKARRIVSKQIASDSKTLWMPPKFLSIHWDGKALPTLTTKYEHEERLAVCVGDSRELKLLGIPSNKLGTGEQAGDVISKLSCDLLNKWNCSDSIINMVFDTTSTNTGHLTAACIRIQEKLDRAILWSACFHHVGELIISHVFTDLKIEVSKSPDVLVFAKLRRKWNNIPGDGELNQLDISSFPAETQELILKWKLELVNVSKQTITHVRDDYKELLTLAEAYINPERTAVELNSPGAVHKARWMAKLIYSLKLVLLEKRIQELPKGTITTNSQVPKLRQFVNFVVMVYCKWWFQCTVAVNAPGNTLDLYKSILMYGSINKVISESAQRTLKRHLWYITPEMVPLALFSSKVPNTEKQELADKLLSMKPASPVTAPLDRFGSGYGKPNFPKEVTLQSKLADFISQDSWFVFSILQLSDDFLHLPVNDWPESESYNIATHNVLAINIVNDVAERTVKLGTDSSARSEDHYQNTLQAVEAD